MFSFDVSAIDVVLALAVVVLLFFYSAHKKPKAPPIEKAHSSMIEETHVPAVEKSYAPIVEEPRVEETTQVREEYEVISKPAKLEDITSRSSESSPNCVHNFGYLESRPEKTSIPDECLGCPKVIKCLIKD